ncbi:HipA domain-containing protein [Parafilimonas sp.]|uniref:HipA domain-containing protein n=1 Tax=Parafilimonas sp. TaxID=1969739 RepID=UPI0039E58ABA
MKRCLHCYLPLSHTSVDYHPACSKKMFGQPEPPELPYAESDLEQLALQVIQSRVAVTGVQPKLSLHLPSDKKNKDRRFTIVGLWGGYILKPPTPHYPQLPEVEDLTMHLALLAKIKTVRHCLIRMKSGSLAYITKRADRTKKEKLAMEDMCQLTERLTEDKYHGSYEQIAKALQRYSSTPGLDVVNFFELLVFSFLTGNADMHLKNFSLIEHPGLGMVLSPAYDLVATKLVNPADDEDLALTLNGKKKKIRKADFEAAFNTAKIDNKQQENIFSKMFKAKQKWMKQIDESFLSKAYKAAFKQLLEDRFKRLD